MSLPDDQLRWLEENIGAQEQWLGTLRRHIAAMQDEASAHEMILALARDQRLLAVLEDLHTQPELFGRVAADPPAFFEERGVRLLDGATVTLKTVTVNHGQPLFAVEARFVTATLKYGVGWSPRSGFYAITEATDARVAAKEA